MTGSNNQVQMAGLLNDAHTYFSANPSDTLVLYFPSGDYHFQHPTTTAITISGFTGTSSSLILRGSGTDATKLVFHQFDQPAILVLGSTSSHVRNVTLEEMHLTRDDEAGFHGVYTSQGTVIATGTGWVKFQVDPGYPTPDSLISGNADRHNIILMPFTGTVDPETYFGTTGMLLSASNPVSTDGNGVCTAYLASDTTSYMAQWLNTPVPWGTNIKVALHAKIGQPTLRFHYTDDCTAHDLLFTRHSANPFLITAASNHCLVDHIDVERFPAINGNAPYFSGPGGGCMTTAETYGHTIRNCIINNSADDGIGCYSFNKTATPSGWLVENNIVRNSGRAFIIESTHSGTLRYNYVFRGDGGAITMGNFAGTSAGTASLEDWHIENNIFEEMRGNPCVNIAGDPDFAGLHDNIYFENNTFINAPKSMPIFRLNFCNRVYIDNNAASFTTEDAMGYLPESGSEAVILIDEGLAVTGTGNMLAQVTTRPIVGLDLGSADVEWGASRTYYSIGSEDGYAAAVSSTSTVGGSVANINSSSGLRAGDDSSNRARKIILSFDTSTLPVDASIAAAAVQMNYGVPFGPAPWTSLGLCYVDIMNGSFSGNSALEPSDFQAVASGSQVAIFTDPGATLKCTRAVLSSTSLALINPTGRTQFRVYFPTQTNNSVDDGIGCFPGEYTLHDMRHLQPQLIVVTDHPPAFASGTAILSRATVGQSYSDASPATDPDGDSLTYSVLSGPLG